MNTNDPRFELIRSCRDGEASAAERAKMESYLRVDPDLRKAYVQYINIDLALSMAANTQPSEESAVNPLLPQRNIWSPWRQLAVAATVVLFAGGWWMLWGGLHAEVARFGTMQGCRWMDAKLNASQGDGLRCGQRVELASGQADIIFQNGAVVTLTGPCIFEVESSMAGFLTLGIMKTRAETPASKGFTVRTRTARVVDLGTEFITSAGIDGMSRVEVTSGEVDVHVNNQGAPQRLKEGDAILVEAGKDQIITRIESGDQTPSFRLPTIEPPSDRDYADARQGHATLSMVSGGNSKTPSLGIRSGPIGVLLNGRAQSGKDAPTESFYIEDGASSWLQCDLGSTVSISKINTYSWHQDFGIPDNRVRAVQQFMLYGFDGDAPPPIEGDAVSTGWVLIARVNTDESFQVVARADRPAQQACSISSARGVIGRYRYLLWHLKPSRDPVSHKLNNTFYGEFDIYAQP